MSGLIKHDHGDGNFSLEIKRKKTTVFDLSDEDFRIATRSKGSWQMTTYDHIDGDDMMILAMMRSQGMPKGMLANGLSEIMHASQEAFITAIERQGATVQ